MSSTSTIPRHTVGKTFIVAVSALGVGALVQLGAFSWIFFSGSQIAFTPASGVGDGTGTGATAVARPFDDPFGAEPGFPAATAPVQESAPIKPKAIPEFPFRPVPITPEPAPVAATPESRFDELINQARLLRDRGDTYTAITRLREAAALDSTSSTPAAELGITYERMGQAEKAAEQWRKVYEMGEAGGLFYTAAEAKLKASQAHALLQSMPAVTAEAGPGATTGEEPPGPAEVGLNPTSKIGLGQITRVPQTDPIALSKFILRVPLHAKPRARLDVRDVAIQVHFYDVIGGRTIDRTTAEVTTRWGNPPPDWSDGDTETLEVTYSLLPPPQGEPLQDRKFYGYVVRVYYKDALQDTRAEPARLGQQFPAPRLLEQANATP